MHLRVGLGAKSHTIVARGAEVFAERWTPIVMRNILYGCRGFSEIAAGAPACLAHFSPNAFGKLERAGVITITAKEKGRGSSYEPTEAGLLALEPVLNALGVWGEMWIKVRLVNTEPNVILWSWCQVCLNTDLLPEKRVVVRFEFEYRGHSDQQRHGNPDPNSGSNEVTRHQIVPESCRGPLRLAAYSDLTSRGLAHIGSP